MKLKFKSNRKAFTLVELLIVIAIIGILFVVLVSKVDFATDKANATGVQTDFRSFQIAFETVSRENAGFNTLGWDTGDKADASLIAGYTYENADKDGGDRIRNSYDKGDMNLNGICEEGETWIGQKLYTETWTGIYTLNNPADADDMSAYLALEKAINKNLDPALHVSIDPENKTIYMANGYKDPWKTEYHGFYLSNAKGDGMDRGAIVMYSDGPNKVFGSEQTIAKGVVTVTVKNNGINGQDDMSIITCYTYMNGYGEIATITEGFSNNQVLSGSGNAGVESMFGPGAGGYQMLSGQTITVDHFNSVSIRSEAPIDKFKGVKLNGSIVDPDNYTKTEGSTIITFKSTYIASLSNDTYEIEILSNDGSAKCELILTQPETVTFKGALYGGIGNLIYLSDTVEKGTTWATYLQEVNATCGYPDGDLWECSADGYICNNLLGQYLRNTSGEKIKWNDIITSDIIDETKITFTISGYGGPVLGDFNITDTVDMGMEWTLWVMQYNATCGYPDGDYFVWKNGYLYNSVANAYVLSSDSEIVESNDFIHYENYTLNWDVQP